MGAALTNIHPRLRSWQPHLEPIAIGGLALALGVFRIGRWGFFGDEYNSLLEFDQPGYHPHSVLYFAVLRIWALVGGQNLEWLRLLSAVFAAGVAVVVFLIAREVSNDQRIAVAAGLLAATSAWRVEEGQEVRFYAYFMSMAGLYLWAIMRLQRTGRAADWAFAGIAALLTLSAHLLGIVFVATGALFAVRRWPTWVRSWLLITTSAVCILLTVLPSLLPATLVQTGYQALGAYQGGNDVSRGYVGPRGASIGTLLKPGYAFYTYLFGSSLYPLNLALMFPALVALSTAAAFGIWELRKEFDVLLLLAAWLMLPMLLVFGALDSLAPPGYTPPAAHHIAPAATSLWLAIAVLAKRSYGRYLVGAALLANMVGLACFFFSDWSLNARKDFDVVTAAAQARTAGCQPTSLLVVDGRMQGPAAIYAGDDCRREGIHTLLGAAAPESTVDQVGLWFNANTSDTPMIVPAFQAQLRSWGFVLVDRWADHPAVVETYRRDGSEVLADGQLALPWSVPPLQFGSLKLPVAAQAVAGTQILGAVVMRAGSLAEWEVPLDATQTMSGLWLTTSTFNWVGESVGQVEAVLSNGTSVMLSMSSGEQTADWAAATCTQCAAAFGWHKRLDALGRSAYPGAWGDFEARGYAYRWVWPEHAQVKSLRFSLAPGTGAGEWWVWQVVPLQVP